MAISVKDIQEKVFPTHPNGGYDVEQVDDFLDEISEQLSALIRENLALTAQVDKLDEALTAKSRELEETSAKTPDYNEAGYFKNLESAMRESLIGAQRLADETTSAAKAQAAQILSDAQANAEKTVADAKAEAEAVTERASAAAAEMKAEYESMKASAEAYRNAFRKLLDEQLQALKASDLLFK